MTKRSMHLGLWLAALACLCLPAQGAPEEPFELWGGRGRPISLVVRDAPLSEVFEMLSRREEVNILLGKDVTGNVSVNLFDVSLDHAVRAIADAAGYVAERRRGTYVIIDRQDAGKDSASGNTVIRAFKIEYSDPEEVSEILQKHLSRYGDLTVLKSRSLLVVEDLPDFVGRIERLLTEIDWGPKQILIEAKILEITLDDSEKFGIDWSANFGLDDGETTFGLRDLAVPGAPGFFFDLMTSDIEVAINALGEDGRVRTLSTPTLLALEHEEAEVVIGDRLGFSVTTTINAVSTETVEFLESGVILKFTASVDRSGRIVLEIHPEVSTGRIEDGLPQQTTTEVTTKLVAEDGQRIFIAGLIKDQETRLRRGIPFLRDIPILGWAFGRTENVQVNTETVVILTARVVDGEAPATSAEMLEKIRRAEDALRKRREKLERDLMPAAPDSEADAGEVEPIADIRPVASADADLDESPVTDPE